MFGMNPEPSRPNEDSRDFPADPTFNAAMLQPVGRKPKLWKKIVAWLLIIFGVGIGIPMVFSGPWQGIPAGICLGLAFVVPGAWHLMNTSLEADGLPRAPRHWGRVLVGSAALFVTGAVAAPDVAQVAPKPNAPQEAPAQGTEDMTYRNCEEAREAGVAPIYRGQPGYASHLDRDGDGIACE